MGAARITATVLLALSLAATLVFFVLALLPGDTSAADAQEAEQIMLESEAHEQEYAEASWMPLFVFFGGLWLASGVLGSALVFGRSARKRYRSGR